MLIKATEIKVEIWHQPKLDARDAIGIRHHKSYISLDGTVSRITHEREMVKMKY